MWETGAIQVNGKNFSWQVKHYEKGSVFGIDGGKISKLWIAQKGKPCCNYDRGWDIEPTTTEAKQACEILIAKFN